MTPAEQYAQQRSHAVALIREHAPQRLQQSLIDLLRPAIALNVERRDDDSIAIGASKFGGAPDVAAGFEWPLWNDKPLGFLAQINLEEVAPFDVGGLLPASGLLSFFYEIDEPDFTDVSTPGSWSVLPFAADNLQRATIDRETELNVARMSFSAGWSSVSTFDIPPEIEDGDWRFEMAVSPCPTVERRLLQGHQMLGYGSPVTYDAAYEAVRRSQGADPKLDERGNLARVSFEETQEWVLLFQLDSDDELNTMWGDVGTLFFMIRKTDLAARDFDKVWMELQFT